MGPSFSWSEKGVTNTENGKNRINPVIELKLGIPERTLSF